MAKAKRRSFDREYLRVPNETAQSPEVRTETPSLSLEALGLLVNICSYSEEWELHKTELYKRYSKNKRTSVVNAWKELTEANYIFEYKYRSGKKWEHVYVYDILPYTDEQIEILRKEALEEHIEIWDVDFQQSKMSTSKWTVQNQQIINTKEKKDVIKEKQIKQNKELVNKFVNKDLDNTLDIDSKQEQEFNLDKEIDEILNAIEPPKEESPKEELVSIANEFYSEFAPSRWSKEDWFKIINKFIDETLARNTVIDNKVGYVYGTLKTIANRHDDKFGKREKPFFDWTTGEEGYTL